MTERRARKSLARRYTITEYHSKGQIMAEYCALPTSKARNVSIDTAVPSSLQRELSELGIWDSFEWCYLYDKDTPFGKLTSTFSLVRELME